MEIIAGWDPDTHEQSREKGGIEVGITCYIMCVSHFSYLICRLRVYYMCSWVICSNSGVTN